MKRAFVAALICFISAGLLAHEHTRDTASVDLGKGKVMIEYGTPKLKGRNIDEMIKPGTAVAAGDGRTHNARNLGRAGLRRQESSPGEIHSLRSAG